MDTEKLKELKTLISNEMAFRNEFRQKRTELEALVSPISKHVKECLKFWNENFPYADEIIVVMDNDVTLKIVKPDLEKCSVESYLPFGINYSECKIVSIKNDTAPSKPEEKAEKKISKTKTKAPKAPKLPKSEAKITPCEFCGQMTKRPNNRFCSTACQVSHWHKEKGHKIKNSKTASIEHEKPEPEPEPLKPVKKYRRTRQMDEMLETLRDENPLPEIYFAKRPEGRDC